MRLALRESDSAPTPRRKFNGSSSPEQKKKCNSLTLSASGSGSAVWDTMRAIRIIE